MQAIFGYLPVYSGTVKLDGEDWKLGDTNYSVNHGFIYLPEERKTYLLHLQHYIRNICNISDNGRCNAF